MSDRDELRDLAFEQARKLMDLQTENTALRERVATLEAQRREYNHMTHKAMEERDALQEQMEDAERRAKVLKGALGLARLDVDALRGRVERLTLALRDINDVFGRTGESACVMGEIAVEALSATPTPLTDAADPETRCANCGTPASEAKHCISNDDGEWACSVYCADQLDELGCPFEHGLGYRTGPPTNAATCPTCDGSGEFVGYEPPPRRGIFSRPCPNPIHQRKEGESDG